MNRLYYSNYCPHSKDVLDFIKRNNFIDKLDFHCVDNRIQDPKTGIMYILSEDRKTKSPLPPHIQEVPALLLVREQYRVILGKEINHFIAPNLKNVFSEVNTIQPTPLTSSTGSGYSMYGEDSSLATVEKKDYIETPPDNFVSNKIGENITIDLLEKQRTADLANLLQPMI
jgi:hypothetical protein